MSHDFSKLPRLIDRHPRKPDSLIMVLQDIQQEYHYLPCEALEAAAEALKVPLSRVFSVATFYNAFSLHRRGDNIVRLCKGTACHIRGANLIQQQLETQLGIQVGQTTPDYKFTLEVVACVGACAMAPVVIVNGKYHGTMNVNTVKKVLKVK
ncbi:MAG TPA: NAD(P)H-dependent oxidoreductase subunit E [Acidobacteriota bacterium]|nr:NAD(P)H-dependent oxidoreductase subunit E [Acidobacteriota bacterium]